MFHPFEVEEFREGRWGLGKCGEGRGRWGGCHADNKSHRCPARFFVEKIGYFVFEMRVGGMERDLRVGGDVMIRGGVVRIR